MLGDWVPTNLHRFLPPHTARVLPHSGTAGSGQREPFPLPLHIPVKGLARHKISGLIKFTVIRQMVFGDKSQYPAPVQNCRRIVELAFMLQGKTDKDQSVCILKFSLDRLQLLLRPV